MESLKFIRKLTSSASFWPLLCVVFFGWLASRTLFGSGYFNMHDDLQMMRQLEMEKCLLDGQIPCRWVPDMGYGYGFPLFNFYPPLPYIIGMVFRLVGYSFVDTAKALFIIAFIASGITMYFFAKEFFGRLGGILAAIFYVWAPYHSVDIFVRGAMNESWALIWFPATLLFAYKIISNTTKHKINTIILLALSWFGLLTTHNLMVLIFTQVFAVWCGFWVLRAKALKSIPSLFLAGVLGFGLAAFFTLPVVLEQKYVHADTLVQGYFEYVAHFSSFRQILFSRFWGYGPSVWMEADDKMSFQVGHFHWILSLVVLALIAIRTIKTKKLPENFLLISIYFIVVGWIAAFMTHSKSISIWQAISPLRFVQFPWRFLTLVILGFSFVVGALPKLLTKKSRVIVSVLLTVGLVIFNWSYFLPEHGKLGPLTDAEKFSGAAWDLQRTAGIYDYLPLTAKENPRDGQNGVAEVITGEAKIINPKQGTNWASLEVDATKESSVRINIYQFPGWKVFVDNQEVNIAIPEEEKWGRMYITVPQGTHQVYAKLYNTPIRTVSNIISLVSWGLLLIYLGRKFIALKVPNAAQASA